MCNYLTKRGATYYFRRVVPDELQAHFARKEWPYSLRTKDRREGEARARLEAVKIDRLIEEARAEGGRSAPPVLAAKWEFSEEQIEAWEADSRDQLDAEFNPERIRKGEIIAEARVRWAPSPKLPHLRTGAVHPLRPANG